MELNFRFGKAFKNGVYVGKIMCSDNDLFVEWLQKMNCECYEITEEEYENLS